MKLEKCLISLYMHSFSRVHHSSSLRLLTKEVRKLEKSSSSLFIPSSISSFNFFFSFLLLLYQRKFHFLVHITHHPFHPLPSSIYLLPSFVTVIIHSPFHFFCFTGVFRNATQAGTYTYLFYLQTFPPKSPSMLLSAGGH